MDDELEEYKRRNREFRHALRWDFTINLSKMKYQLGRLIARLRRKKK